MRLRSYFRTLGLLAVLLAVSGACGTRVDDSATAPSAFAGLSPVGQAHESSEPPASSMGGAPVPVPTAPTSPGTVPTGAPITVAGPQPRQPLPSGVTGAPIPSRGQSPGVPSGEAAEPVPPRPGLPPGGPGAAPAGGPKSAVMLGTAGTLSGPAGTVLGPVVQGLQVWAKDVNARGGVNNHEVKLNIYDDAGDPARHRAQVQQAVEKDGVKAFLANPEAITGGCCVDYINAKRIPMIGSETGSPWFNNNPMYFPQASSGDDSNYGAIATVAQQMIPKGKNKVAAFTCVEAQICKDAQRVWSASAEELGLKVVYQRQVSIGQPDFTAECLAARNAGADVVLMGFDTNTVRRMVSSCSRQSYRPTYATLTVAITSTYKDDPNLDGMVAASPVFPWFATGTPATDQYQVGMKRFGSNIPASTAVTIGWVAGKVFERAASTLPEPPTSEAILKGLWSIQNDDIAGLTLPLTYQREKPSPQRPCWFNMLLKDGAWQSPDMFKLNCK